MSDKDSMKINQSFQSKNILSSKITLKRSSFKIKLFSTMNFFSRMRLVDNHKLDIKNYKWLGYDSNKYLIAIRIIEELNMFLSKLYFYS